MQTVTFGTIQLSVTWLYLVMLMGDPGPSLKSFLNLLQLHCHDLWAQTLPYSSALPLLCVLSLCVET